MSGCAPPIQSSSAFTMRWARDPSRTACAMSRDPESRAMIAQTRAALDFTPRDDLPEVLVGATPLLEIETIRAPELRKLLNKMLAKRLAAKPQKRIGGELVYEGSTGDIPLRVS